MIGFSFYFQIEGTCRNRQGNFIVINHFSNILIVLAKMQLNISEKTLGLSTCNSFQKTNFGKPQVCLANEKLWYND